MGENPVLAPLVLLALASISVAVIVRQRIKSHRAALIVWAKQHGLELLECTYRYFSRGPLAFRRAGSDTVYRIRVRNARGKEWSGFARVGGLFRARVKVAFDH